MDVVIIVGLVCPPPLKVNPQCDFTLGLEKSSDVQSRNKLFGDYMVTCKTAIFARRKRGWGVKGDVKWVTTGNDIYKCSNFISKLQRRIKI